MAVSVPDGIFASWCDLLMTETAEGGPALGIGCAFHADVSTISTASQ
jgi:hypothetical protein